jgi:hypothetical protein
MRGKFLILIGDHEHELMAANPKLGSVLELSFPNLGLADEGSIGAAQVLKSGFAAVNRQQGVLSGHFGVIERDVTLDSADRNVGLAQLENLSFSFAFEDHDGVSLYVGKDAAGHVLALEGADGLLVNGYRGGHVHGIAAPRADDLDTGHGGKLPLVEVVTATRADDGHFVSP